MIVHYEDDRHVLVSNGPVLVSINHVAPAVLGVRRVAVAIGEIAVKHERVTVVLVPAARRPSLSLEVTQEITGSWKRLAPKIAAGVIWVRREGFIGSVVRSLIAGILLMRPRDDTPISVVTSLEEVMEAVAQRPAPADYRSWLEDLEY